MTTRRHSPARSLAARAVQTFDGHGECEHRTVSREFGQYRIIWSTRDECIWCGNAQEWK